MSITCSFQLQKPDFDEEWSHVKSKIQISKAPICGPHENVVKINGNFLKLSLNYVKKTWRLKNGREI